jgi:hypothetical protein
MSGSGMRVRFIVWDDALLLLGIEYPRKSNGEADLISSETWRTMVRRPLPAPA